MSKKDKTNVMRVLELHQIDYQGYEWIQVPRESVSYPIYKTLVTVGKSRNHYVFVIPVTQELDLKKAAQAVGEKNIQLIPEKELLPLTGYVHGGCSPIGMKKEFVTVIDQSAQSYEQILFSAGKVGFAVQVDPRDLIEIIRFKIADVAKEKGQ